MSLDTNTNDPSSAVHNASHETDATNPNQTEAGIVEVISMRHDPTIGADVRELRLTIGQETKTIFHYLYAHWPDFGKPEAEERAALMQLLKASRATAAESPRVVHCSAGVGRTGTFIALDYLTSELSKGRIARTPSQSSNSEISSAPSAQSHGINTSSASNPAAGTNRRATTPEQDEQQQQQQTDAAKPREGADLIYDTVEQLRQQRMMMVMNEVQYTLLYEILREEFIALYAEKETGAVVVGELPFEGDDAEGPSPKVARVARDGGGDVGGSELGPGRRGSEGGYGMQGEGEGGSQHSEAETEIADGGETTRPDTDGVENLPPPPSSDPDEDPYAAVAPEQVLRGLQGQRHD
jgi:protein-tyrosine phosphatase